MPIVLRRSDTERTVTTPIPPIPTISPSARYASKMPRIAITRDCISITSSEIIDTVTPSPLKLSSKSCDNSAAAIRTFSGLPVAENVLIPESSKSLEGVAESLKLTYILVTLPSN